MIRPACTAAFSGANADNPRAITSAFTNSVTPSAPCSTLSAAVDFPAPFGPAKMITRGPLITTS